MERTLGFASSLNHLNDVNVNYMAYQTPPHSSPVYSYNWSEILKPPPSPTEEHYQQQHMRFPTPPTTPNRLPQEPIASSPLQSRRQSVIMKVDQRQNLQHFNLAHELHLSPEDSNLNPMTSHLTNLSGSDSSSAASDFICAWQDCGRYFESLKCLAQHVTQIHAVANLNDSLYYCRWTGCQRSERGFNARYKMLVHVRTHTKEKPHKCDLCDKSFSRAENLKIHIRSHSGEKPYKCTFEGCTKAYSNSSDRFKHTRTHTMEKPYKCKVPGCQKRYTDPSSLRKHVKTFKHSLQIIENPLTVSSLKQQQQQEKYEENFSNLNQKKIHHEMDQEQDQNQEREHDSLKLSNNDSSSPLSFHSMKSFYPTTNGNHTEDSDIVMEKLPLQQQFFERNATQATFYWLPEEALLKNFPTIYNETYYPLHHHHHHQDHHEQPSQQLYSMNSQQQHQQHEQNFFNHHHLNHFNHLNHDDHYHLQNYPMNLEIERPLDLRVHKVQ